MELDFVGTLQGSVLSGLCFCGRLILHGFQLFLEALPVYSCIKLPKITVSPNVWSPIKYAAFVMVIN